MLTRRSILGSTALLLLPTLAFAQVASTAPETPTTAEPVVHEVQMLNADPDNSRERMIFSPAVLFINPGDTVRFVSTDRGHNSKSIDTMLPEGATPWATRINADEDITLDVEGVYGYGCTPHLSMGMVGLIVVGTPTNLEDARAVQQRIRPVAARFDTYFAEVDARLAEMAATDTTVGE